MALPQTIGFKAEAVDEEGIWCPCTVEDVSNDYVIVSFDGWNAEWNRRICDPREIRNRTEPDRKRKRRNLSSTKVRYSYSLFLISDNRSLISYGRNVFVEVYDRSYLYCNVSSSSTLADVWLLKKKANIECPYLYGVWSAILQSS